MTIAELERYVKSYQRTQKVKAQEKAAYDYILAALIGTNVAAHFGEVKVPSLAETYGHLFQEENEALQEKKQDAKIELSALRFKQFANAYNDKFIKS